jgi:hypothetical protein
MKGHLGDYAEETRIEISPQIAGFIQGLEKELRALKKKWAKAVSDAAKDPK